VSDDRGEATTSGCSSVDLKVRKYNSS